MKNCAREWPSNSASRSNRKILKFLDDLPKTRNAKIMRRIIRASYLDQDPGDLSALENPQSVEAVRNAI